MSDERKEYLTKEKYEELKNELDFLTSQKRREIAEQLEYAKSLGDLSENAEYHQARDLQARVEDRISQLAAILKSAEIVTPRHGATVDVGSTVVVEKENDGNGPRTFQIVGSEEADMAQGKISLNAPLGQAMMGKKKDDAFTLTTPSGSKVRYTIVEVK